MTEIDKLKQEIELLKQQVKDCHLYMTDTQKWQMARDNASIELDIMLERRT
jgi:hypothetical protein